MLIDLYVNTEQEEAVVLIDRPLPGQLVCLELDRVEKRLFFVFKTKRQDMGYVLKDELMNILLQRNNVRIIEMEMPARRPKAGVVAPLRIL